MLGKAKPTIKIGGKEALLPDSSIFIQFLFNFGFRQN